MNLSSSVILITDGAVDDPSVVSLAEALERAGIAVFRRPLETVGSTLNTGDVLVAVLTGTPPDDLTTDRTAPLMAAARAASHLDVPIIAVRATTDSLWLPAPSGSRVRSIDLWTIPESRRSVEVINALRQAVSVASVVPGRVALSPLPPPVAVPGYPAALPVGDGGLRSLQALANWTVAALAVGSVLSVFLVFVYGDVLRFLNPLSLSDGSNRMLNAFALDQQTRLFSELKIGVSVVFSGLFLLWLARAYNNLPALHVTQVRYSTKEAIGSFFIPFLSLIRPAEAVHDLWVASAPEDEPGSGRSVLIPIWWGCAALSSILGRFASLALRSQPAYQVSLAQRAQAVSTSLVMEIAGAVALSLAIVVVRGVTQRQIQRFDRLYPGTQGSPARRNPCAWGDARLTSAVQAVALFSLGMLFWHHQNLVAHPDAPWTQYRDPDRLFAAEFPMTPSSMDPAGDDSARTRIYRADDGTTTCTLFIVREGVLHDRDTAATEALLAKVAAGIIRSEHLSRPEVTMRQQFGNRALSVQGVDSEGKVLSARVLAIPGVIYEGIAVRPAAESPETADRFLNSILPMPL